MGSRFIGNSIRSCVHPENFAVQPIKLILRSNQKGVSLSRFDDSNTKHADVCKDGETSSTAILI